MEQKKLKPCPFRIHGVRQASLTVAGEYYYNECFQPCMGDACACYMDDGYIAKCHRNNVPLTLWIAKEVPFSGEEGGMK